MVGEYVKLEGGPSRLHQLKADEAFASAKDGMLEKELLFTLLGAYNVLDKISSDLSLARGLDYYTGIIYENLMVIKEQQPEVVDGKKVKVQARDQGTKVKGGAR
ncbi:hypothetical protein OG21DRAFT_1489995 [Imleria badia]|nr:hypothetical protein OG21DRAFT_1489995 [Imleria badia]